MSDNIKVVVKVRPLIAHEIAIKQQCQWRIDDNTLYQVNNFGQNSFTFDKVYGEESNTTAIYNDVAKPIVDAAVAGFNGTIFAYGQTSSGKTYTMTGTDNSPGIIPLAVLNLFDTIRHKPDRDFVVSVSYMEIYNETLRDLLDLKKTNLKIQETFNGGIKVPDVTEKNTASPDEVLEAMKEGNANRQTGSTNMNENSSRSHSIFQITIESREHLEGEEQAGSVNVSQLNLVDLAGSERAGQTGATGKRFTEGTHINKSLLALAQVINLLTEGPNKFVNYRDSKLTRLLQNSLGGNAKTSIICAITPAALEETISTLQFATRAKAIKNKPKVNEVATDATMIQRLTQQLCSLQTKLQSKEVILETKKHKEQDLQKQISNLRRFILNARPPAVEMLSGARKKLLQPRRITISTLHSITEDAPEIPKFCTPSLKYNPLVYQSMQPSLPEEPLRVVTPPPTRTVNFSNEVVLIDSDDDECSSVSPFHKCKDTSKTPPCILRKNAKQAEKNYNELLEMTETEKMYPPDVVELMKKIELSTAKTMTLQDEIEVLKTDRNKKDLEIEDLRSKINLADTEIKTLSSDSIEIEKLRREYHTKQTDWEVSFETLKNKAKLREEELLSLLEEQRVKQTEDIGKMPFKQKDREIINFMDMSKDLSLVNSDNETSIVHPEDNANIMKDFRTQVEAKDQTISDLLSDINTQKRAIDVLQKSNQDLIGESRILKESIGCLENEKQLYKSTIDELNCTIKSQKENLELFQSDIDSCKNTIQELHDKLNKKETLLSMHISDDFLECMVTNEEKVIANNENLQNIIHNFKLALQNSKHEIVLLKSRIQNNNDASEQYLIESIKSKDEQIEQLNNEISKLLKESNENILTVNTLLEEKKYLASVEQELVRKISEEADKNLEHAKLSKESFVIIENLKKDKDTLTVSLADLSNKEKELSDTKKKMLEKLNVATDRVSLLEQEINKKDILIKHLEKQNVEFQECLESAIKCINKLQCVLTGEVQVGTDVLDSLTFTYISDNMSKLEGIILSTVSEKEIFQKTSMELQEQLNNLVHKHKFQIKELTDLNEGLNVTLQRYEEEIKRINNLNNEQINAISKTQLELNDKNTEITNIEGELNQCRKTIVDKSDFISSLMDKENTLLKKVELLETEIIHLSSKVKSKDDMHQSMSNKDQMITQIYSELEEKLHEKIRILTQTEGKLYETQNENSKLFDCIVCKLNDIIGALQEKSTLVKNYPPAHCNSRDHILPILNAVEDHLIMQSALESDNMELRQELGKINDFNVSLKCDLEQSSELLKQLKSELKLKAAEIVNMEHKVYELKTQFNGFDENMKEQMLFLKTENDYLKKRKTDLTNDTKMQINLLSSEGVTQISPNILQTLPEECEDNRSPRSLLTICCDIIKESMDSRQIENIAVSASSPCILPLASVKDCSSCDQLVLEIRIMQQEKNTLVEQISQLQTINEQLIHEQTEVRDEIHLLLGLTPELQKRILNHRTSLSTLTATTHTENKSLQLQVKSLQHHHSRFHNVCRRDLPEFKKQLNELLIILKDDSSFCDSAQFSTKRYSLPNINENNQSKNDYTLDDDLLMLDTNVTQTTVDNTLVGCNQTCLDITQTMFNDTGVQTDYNVTEPINQSDEMLTLKNYNYDIKLKLVKAAEENNKLKEQLAMYLTIEESKAEQFTPKKIGSDTTCTKCNTNILNLTERLSAVTKEKDDLGKKYEDLVMDMALSNSLINKLKTVEENCLIKESMLKKVTDNLKMKCEELKALQEENDALSSQVIDNISEMDDLNKVAEKLKQDNLKLMADTKDCPTCYANGNILNPKRNDAEGNHSRLNRSMSDSETMSRHNKINTLQSEIHAGREYCKVLTEDVVNIKHDLDQSNVMSMDLDESMADYELANEMPTSPRNTIKSDTANVQEKISMDLYSTDKADCLNFYLEKTDTEEGKFACDIKIIEVLKLLHNYLVTKHANEVENLTNQLKDYQETQNNLQIKLSTMQVEYSEMNVKLEEKDKALNTYTDVLTHLKNNLSLINIDCKRDIEYENKIKLSDDLKTKFLLILDKEFNLTSVNIFEQLFNKYEFVLNNTVKECDTLRSKTEKLAAHLEAATNESAQLRSLISEKDKEYALLKGRYEKIHEINSAVTLEIVKKDQENHNIITEAYRSMVEQKVIDPIEIPFPGPSNVQVFVQLFELVLQKTKVKLSQEIKDYKLALEEKEILLCGLKSENEVLEHKNSKEVAEKDYNIQRLVLIQDENQKSIEKLSSDINNLKEIIRIREETILELSDNNAKTTELLNAVRSLQEDNDRLKAVNQAITTDYESYASELKQSSLTIKQNNTDIDKMTSDILVLRESLKEATASMENMNKKIEILTRENSEIKHEFEVKCQDCSRLEINIKTHEKTAEIQSRMIMRLQKQLEDEKCNREKQTNHEITEKFVSLQNECETLRNTVKTLNEEINNLKIAKDILEVRVSESKDSGPRSRASLDPIADSTKQRRRSLHDSKRMFEDFEDNRILEAVFESGDRPDDTCMDVDDDISDRSTPFELIKGHDSLLSKTGHSDKDEDRPSRPNSVVAIRRRRQSVHDLHRSVTPHASSPLDLSNISIDEHRQLQEDSSKNKCNDNEVNQLRTQLAACVRELEVLKESYKELDVECETCAEYLRERDAQCLRLKKEKVALEHQVTELKAKVNSPVSNPLLKPKPSVAHVSVNTDEDWTNLHAVVVDRMSFDAEVEKNKKLTKTIEELRFTKLDLKNTLAKLQKALERNNSKDHSRELETMRQDLKASRHELEELKARYKELDEECEMCAQYLKEREEQCRRLNDAKTALETKLQELQDNAHHAHDLNKTARKKRQTFHDMNRPESMPVNQIDASTETTDDCSSSQMERDDSAQGPAEDPLHDVKHRKTVEKLTRQISYLEHHLRTANAAHTMYVATGSAIVQNQQITDVMKENRKLKNINAKLVNMCKKRGKNVDANRENEDPCEQG